MVNVLVMTHGQLAAGMTQSVGMVIGEQENFSCLTFHPEQSLDSLIESLKQELQNFGNDLPCLVLVDLLGGSPSNAIVHLIAEGFELQAVAGVNLPMLVTALTERDIYATVEDLAKQVKTAGVEGVVNIIEKLMEE